ncbi:MAG: hypothetical protein ACKVS7_07145 [Gemmatimonadaceae bacterium]
MPLRSRVATTVALLGFLSSAVGAQTPSRVDYSQLTRPVVVVTDTALIRFLLYELVIEPLRPPTRLDVVDVTLNGYGPDDILVVHPSMETFLIPALLPDSVQRVMAMWAPLVEFRLDAGNLTGEALASLVASAPDSARRAEQAILYDVVQAIERNYRDIPMALLFQRDSVGFTFQLWDYNRPSMSFRPRAALVSDSAVASAVALLRDVGYVPERGAEARAAGRMVSVDRALEGIRTYPDEQTRQLAARTLLVGSYDLDRSGAIDGAREVDAIPCDVWTVLNRTFTGGLAQFGFADATGAYTGNIVLNISESVRAPAGRRAEACLAGAAPPPTSESAVSAPVRAAPLPSEVNAFLALDAANEILERAGRRAPGSADWASDVRRLLLERFDGDASGLLDRRMEIAAVPCAVWQAIVGTHATVVRGLGFEDGAAYAGDRIGIASPVRTDARTRLEGCASGAGSSVSRRIRAAAPSAAAATVRPSGSYSPVDALVGVRAFPEEERRLAARTIMLAFYDLDRSGYLDAGLELDAITCQVWSAMSDVFPGFAEAYGFVPDPTGTRLPFRGTILLNLVEALAEPAGARITACRNGRQPPATAVATVPVTQHEVRLPAALAQYLDAGIAVRLARATLRFEPGSAGWAAAVQLVLIEEYDLDGSGLIDAADEIDAIPCIVWSTVRATHGGGLAPLGFGGTGSYFGDRIGVAARVRDQATRRLESCGR